jgi:glycerol-3-phosphate dehydrogenase
MFRDLGRLTATEHDLLVIGGGISGLITAYDAAQRGLSVALIDRGDFGAATSFNHLKTVHGGLRYLQRGDLRRMRRSVLERRAFATIAPHMVLPLAFLAPTTRTPTRSRLAFRMAFGIDGWIGRDRNAGLPRRLHLPAGQVISVDECRRLVADLDLTGATGAALWYDYQIPVADRLTLAFALAASAHGATLSNYVEALTPLRDGDVVRGVRARDVANRGESLEIRARMTVNAAGPWARSVMSACGIRRDVPLLKAVNLVTRRAACGPAVVRSTRHGRALVLAPWHGRALIGTSESTNTCGPDDRDVTPEELRTFLDEINTTFPTLSLRADEVSLIHRGIVPAVVNHGRARLRPHPELIDHGRDEVQGLITAIGVKYTTARLLAEQTVDLVMVRLGRGSVPCRTSSVPLPGAFTETPDALAAALVDTHGHWLDKSSAAHLATAYGTDCHQIVALAAQDQMLRERVAPDTPVLRAEVVHAVRHEMALTLTDVVVRRTPLGTAGHPGSMAAQVCTDLLGRELQWTAERASSEIERLRAFYAPIGA